MPIWRWCRTAIDNGRWIPVAFPVPGGTRNPPPPNRQPERPWYGAVVERGPLVNLEGKPKDDGEP